MKKIFVLFMILLGMGSCTKKDVADKLEEAADIVEFSGEVLDKTADAMDAVADLLDPKGKNE